MNFKYSMKHAYEYKDGLCGLVTMLALAIAGGDAMALDYWVAPDGNDGNPGTQQAPFATIQHARDAVRAQIAGGMSGDITVHLGAGNYFIEPAGGL